MGSIAKWSVVPIALALSVTRADAEQAAGPWINVPVCTAPGWRFVTTMISDGRNGAILGWYDTRNVATGSSGVDVFAQRLDAAGIPVWTADGLPLCSAPREQNAVTLASDGEGGVIAAWTDFRDGPGVVYAQRVDSRGRALWDVNGIKVAPSRGGLNAGLEADGSGGAFVVWQGNTGNGIYAQHLDPRGRLLWGPGGVEVCTAAWVAGGASVVGDGSGGAILAWSDGRQAGSRIYEAGTRIYAQHLNARGLGVWGANGIALCSFESGQRSVVVVGDGAGGAIAVWKDSRKAVWYEPGLFAERVDGSGRVLWDPMGVDLCKQAVSGLIRPVAVANHGGAIVAWDDRRSGGYDIYMQSVSESGRTVWNENGVAACVAPGEQVFPAIAPDEAGGAFVAWQDLRAAQGAIYAQHVDDKGTVLWGVSGVAVSGEAGASGGARIAGDGRGGAFVAWTDQRRGRVLAERITSAGPKGRVKGDGEARTPPPPVVSAFAQGDGISVRVVVASGTNVRAAVYDVAGRSVRRLADGYVESGEHVVRWDARDESGKRVSSGVYFVRVQTGEGVATLRTVVTK